MAGLAQGLPDPSACHRGPPVMDLLVGAFLLGTLLYQEPDPKKGLAQDEHGIRLRNDAAFVSAECGHC